MLVPGTAYNAGRHIAQYTCDRLSTVVKLNLQSLFKPSLVPDTAKLIGKEILGVRRGDFNLEACCKTTSLYQHKHSWVATALCSRTVRIDVGVDCEAVVAPREGRQHQVVGFAPEFDGRF